MNINQRKAGVILSYLLSAVNALVGFIYIPLLIYFLGQEEYGLYQIMGSFLVFLSLFDFGLSNTVTRYYSKFIALKDDVKKENLLALSSIIYIMLSLLLTFVGMILYFFLDDMFKNSLSNLEIEKAKQMYIIILIASVITISSAVYNSIITSHEKFIFLRGLSIAQTIFRPIVVYAIFLIEANALILVIIQALINIICIVLKILYSNKKLQVKIKLHYLDVDLLKEMFRYSFFIFLTAIMDQIFWRADQIILGIIVGTGAVAVYSVGSQVIMYYMVLAGAMTGVFLPKITKRVAENASNLELTNIFIRLGRLQYIFLGAVLTGFIIFGKEFIGIWVGEDFNNAYYITIIIMIPFTIDLIQNIGLTILQAKNMYAFRAIVFLGMAIMNIVISIPLALHYGGIGAAFATSIAYLIGNGLIMNFYYYKKVNLNIYKFWKEIIKLSVLFLIIGGGGILINNIFNDMSIAKFIIKLFLFANLYLTVIWNLGLNSYEKNLVLIPIRKVLLRKKVSD